ncbi:hypothetical protein LMIY3S_01799 [Labrys miyagiensis]
MGKIENLVRPLTGRRAQPEAPMRSEARERLAAAIERHRAAVAEVARNGEAYRRLGKRLDAAEAELEEARERLHGARVLRKERLLDERLPEPATSVREAEDEVERLTEEVALLAEAWRTADARRVGPGRHSGGLSQFAVNDAIVGLLKTDGAAPIEKLVEEARTALRVANDRRQAIDFLVSIGVVAEGSVSDLWTVGLRTTGSREAEWRGCVEKLKQDAGAALPE